MSASEGDRNAVMEVVREAVRELNSELGYESLESIQEATAFWGSADGVDSLSLIQFAVDLEGRVEERFGVRVPLTDDNALATAESPFRTIGHLVDYITGSLSAAESRG